MNRKSLTIIFVVLIAFLALGIMKAEKGLNTVMGLKTRPKSFDLVVHNAHECSVTVLGKCVNLQRYYRIGNIFAKRGYINLDIHGKKVELNFFVPGGVVPKACHNLDKKLAKRYN